MFEPPGASPAIRSTLGREQDRHQNQQTQRVGNIPAFAGSKQRLRGDHVQPRGPGEVSRSGHRRQQRRRGRNQQEAAEHTAFEPVARVEGAGHRRYHDRDFHRVARGQPQRPEQGVANRQVGSDVARKTGDRQQQSGAGRLAEEDGDGDGVGEPDRRDPPSPAREADLAPCKQEEGDAEQEGDPDDGPIELGWPKRSTGRLRCLPK